MLANPILLLLSLIHQLDETNAGCGVAIGRRKSGRTGSNATRSILQAVDPLTDESHSSMDVLAALVIAGHLRHRLPRKFDWGAEKNASDDELDVLSGPGTFYCEGKFFGEGSPMRVLTSSLMTSGDLDIKVMWELEMLTPEQLIPRFHFTIARRLNHSNKGNIEVLENRCRKGLDPDDDLHILVKATGMSEVFSFLIPR